MRKPLRLGTCSMPNPDLMLLQRKNYSQAYPEPADVLLLIEVRQSPENYERLEKIPLYAAAGISEVWLVDPEEQIIEQYTGPLENRYEKLETHTLTQTIASINLPEFKIALTDIFEPSEDA